MSYLFENIRRRLDEIEIEYELNSKTGLKKQLSDLEKHLEQKNAQVRDLKHRCNDQQLKIAKLGLEIGNLANEIREKDATILNLEIEIREKLS